MKTRISSIVVVLLIWWLASLVVPNSVLPGPHVILQTFVNLMCSGATENAGSVCSAIAEPTEGNIEVGLPQALMTSMTSLLYGASLSMLIGIPLGIMMGVWRVMAEMLEYYVSALYVIPMSAVVPLMVLWFGFDPYVQVIFILIFTVPQVVITCYEGVKTVSPELIEVAQAFRAKEQDIFFKVIVPFVIPFIITALRLGIGRAVQGMVVAEILLGGTNRGIGTLIRKYSASVDIPELLAVVIFIMLLGILATVFVRWIENAIAPWQRGMVTGSGE